MKPWKEWLILSYIFDQVVKLPSKASKNGFGNTECLLQLEVSSSVDIFATHVMSRVRDCGRATEWYCRTLQIPYPRFDARVLGSVWLRSQPRNLGKGCDWWRWGVTSPRKWKTRNDIIEIGESYHVKKITIATIKSFRKINYFHHVDLVTRRERVPGPEWSAALHDKVQMSNMSTKAILHSGSVCLDPSGRWRPLTRVQSPKSKKQAQEDDTWW